MALDPNINRIKFLRSTTAGAVPAASLLQDGELAINLVDRTIYSKNGANVVELGFGKGGSVKGNVDVSGTIKASGTITAPTFSGALNGNAATATKLQTARTISLTGSATGSISFDGTSNQSISVNVNKLDALATFTRSNDDSPTKWAQGVQSVFVSSAQGWPMPYGGVITARPHSNGGGALQILTAYGSGSTVGNGEIKIRTGDYSGAGNDVWTSWKTLVHSENVNDYSPTKTGVGASGTWGIAVTGNAASATKLATARTIGGVSFNGTANINLPGVNTTGNQSTTGSAASLTTARSFSWTGDATGSLSFNGSANVSAVLTLANSGVAAGTYKSVTVDTKGRVTAGTNVITGLVTSTAATGTTNAATSNTNTYLNIVETIGSAAATVGTSTQVTGAGTVTVTSDTAGKLTITGSQSITGNAATATRLQTARTINGTSFNGSANINIDNLAVIDNRIIKPNNAPKRALTPYFTSAGGLTTTTADSVYGDFLVLNGYSDTSGGNVNGLWFDKKSQTIKHYQAAQGATTWGTPKTIAYTDGNITGNAATATRLQTARTIAISGAVTGTATSFNGSANITIATTAIDGSKISTGTIPAARIPTLNQSTTGNAASATKLQTARTIGGVSFDGTANINLPGVNTTGNQSTTGNAATATTLQTARNIGITGSGASGAVSFNGTGNVNIPLVVATQPATTNNATIATTAFVQAVNSADTGSAATAVRLKTARKINGVAFDGTKDIQTDCVRIGAISWTPSKRNMLWAGDLALDGQVLNRADYPELWSIVSAGRVVTVTDAAWLGNKNLRGNFTPGNGTTTFRLPDLNGVQNGSIPNLFIRGAINDAGCGAVEDDAIRNITGKFEFGASAFADTIASGSFVSYDSGRWGDWMGHGQNGAQIGGVSFDASKTVPVADENRPKSVYGLWIISAKGSNVIVPGASTAATLTGGNTFQGGQKIVGPLEVTGALNADIKPLLNAAGAAPVFGVRAWASIQGQTGNMFAQGNVLSVQRVSMGIYNIKFITPMPHANYAISCAAMTVTDDTRIIFAFRDKTAAGFSLEVVAIQPNWHGFADSGDVSITVTC